MTKKPGDFVLPGDKVSDLNHVKDKVIIGPGLRRNDDEPNSLVVTRAGTLQYKPTNVYWVEGRQKRYIPKKGDLVVGTVIKKGGETLKVDIGGSELASLSVYAFEGATKKQRPDIQVGDVIYARLLSAHREMEPELVCVDSYSKAGKMGVLPSDGFVMSVSLNLVYRLLNVENPLLRTLGKKFPYEIAIGMNGKVWLKTRRVQETLNLIRALQAAETQSDKSIMQLCRQF